MLTRHRSLSRALCIRERKEVLQKEKQLLIRTHARAHTHMLSKFF
jgi:hypothetical protein